MIKCKEVVEVTNAGPVALLGENVEVRCNVYIYAGKLVGVNDKCLELDNAHIVYETGPHNADKYTTAEKIPDGQLVFFNLIESMGPTKKKF